MCFRPFAHFTLGQSLRDEREICLGDSTCGSVGLCKQGQETGRQKSYRKLINHVPPDNRRRPYGNRSPISRPRIFGPLPARPSAHGARWARCVSRLGEKQLLVLQRSHQLSVGSHPTPSDLYSTKGRQATAARLWQRQRESLTAPVAR